MKSDVFNPFNDQGAIDLTAFIGQWPFRSASRADADDLVQMANKHGLTGLCVSVIDSIFGYDTRTGNEILFREAAKDERLLPFPIINPADASWQEELAWAAKSGAKGIRLTPGYHGYKPNEPFMADLLQELAAVGLPIQLCTRLFDPRFQHPRYPADEIPLHTVAEWITMSSATQNLMVSGLRIYEWDTIARHLPADFAADHVLCDLWFVNGPIAAIASLSASGLTDRFAYGSCTPIQTAEATMLQLASANVTKEERFNLSTRNALRFLGSTFEEKRRE